MIAEQCKAKGSKSDELQYRKFIAEMNFKASKDSLIKKIMFKKILRFNTAMVPE
jgi:hypothetical protein